MGIDQENTTLRKLENAYQNTPDDMKRFNKYYNDSQKKWHIERRTILEEKMRNHQRDYQSKITERKNKIEQLKKFNISLNPISRKIKDMQNQIITMENQIKNI